MPRSQRGGRRCRRSGPPTTRQNRRRPVTPLKGAVSRIRGTNGEHIWMADVRRPRTAAIQGRFANAPRDLPGKKAGEVASVQGSRHLGLDVHAERQDRRWRDHQAAAERHCRRPTPTRFARADGNEPKGKAAVKPGHDEVRCWPVRHGCPVGPWLVPTPPMAEKPKTPETPRPPAARAGRSWPGRDCRHAPDGRENPRGLRALRL